MLRNKTRDALSVLLTMQETALDQDIFIKLTSIADKLIKEVNDEDL